MAVRNHRLWLFALLCALLIPSWSVGVASAASCPNEAFRTGPSTALPDCRAYELVTPPGTNGRMLYAISAFGVGRANDLFPVELASPVNDSFLYETVTGALPAPKGGSGVFDTYKAVRESAGWNTSEILAHPPTEVAWPLPGGVSADHQYSFQRNAHTTYLRSPDGSFELAGIGSLGTEPAAQGRYISDGGAHVIFTTGHSEQTQSGWCPCPVKQLEPTAAPTGTGAIYDRGASGPTHVVSLLPGNVPASSGEEAFYHGVSKDGGVVAFTINNDLYVRVDNQDTEEVAGANPTFAGLSDDGRYLYYVAGGTIHRFDTSTEGDVEVNPTGEAEVVNVSADRSHVYFISEQQLDGGKGVLGQPNMYEWSGGSPSYIATVAPSDLVVTSGSQVQIPALTNWTDWVFNPPLGVESGPGAESSRTTPDGSVLVFESRAQLTSYPNEGHTEIYRYDDADHSLLCVSCNPSGSPAEADASLQNLRVVPSPVVIHNVSDGGHRVFFETAEALVEGDTNEVNDIYEWQEEEGSAGVRLISTGTSPEYPLPPEIDFLAPRPNVLMAVTPDGANVFFMAEQPLMEGAGEGGTEGIYDARVDGGFPAPAIPAICLEEACRASATGPNSLFAPAQSESLRGRGNIAPGKKSCHHPHKGQRRGKHHRCGKRRGARSSSVGKPATVATTETQAAEASVDSGGSSPLAATHPVSAATSPVASLGSEVEEFGITRFEAEESTAGAAAHPDFTNIVEFNHSRDNEGHDTPKAVVEELSISLPPGLLGNLQATPRCEMGNFVAYGNCPIDSQVGITRVRVGSPLFVAALEPIYNLVPPHPRQEIARFGLIAGNFPVFIDISVRTAGDYGATATIHNPPGLGTIFTAKTTFWGNPAASTHDEERLTPAESAKCTSIATCKPVGGSRESGIPVADRKAFLSNPSACQANELGLEVTATQLPGRLFTAHAPLVGADTQTPATSDCSGLPFAPTLEAEPTNHVAGAATGLKTKLIIPQHLGEDERATATMREARVTLPAGMQVAAGAANWIGTCSEEQVGYHKEVDTACPDSSKLGTAKIISPALSVPIEGTIYQRSPQPGHQLGLWLTADALGLHVKLPGELEPDRSTGRLTAVFRDLPQVPVEEIDLNVWGGPRAPLQNPDHCGSFATDFSFAPHSNDPAVVGHSDMQITEGCNQPFAPTLHAGVTEPVAGKFSPFVFDLNRPDGDQALRGFSLHLPEGAIGKPKGVPLCPDEAAATGTCPADSRIGSLEASTGPGPDPLQVPQAGKAQPAIYFAGPYQGAPFSIVSEVPAQAGPFDLGVLAVRSALQIDPETARATVVADPLPQFFEGIGITYRHLHAVIDRPEFFLNPTDCREMAVTADATSTQGTVAHPSARFQVDGCKALGFKPKLSLRLKGGTERADYPALTAVLQARKGDANIAFTSVALPHSEFLAQEHIGTICTRVQFAADKCPKGSVYGKAKAITPLLEKPLSGPVYLRSSNHPLPDLVAKLGGQLEIDLVGRIDSVHGGIRATFESVPDAPVTKFVLQMRGGRKSLLTNSTDICRGSHRATAQFKAQNGRAARLRPALVALGCGKKKLGKHKIHH
jgi:hypothetical protein